MGMNDLYMNQGCLLRVVEVEPKVLDTAKRLLRNLVDIQKTPSPEFSFMLQPGSFLRLRVI